MVATRVGEEEEEAEALEGEESQAPEVVGRGREDEDTE